MAKNNQFATYEQALRTQSDSTEQDFKDEIKKVCVFLQGSLTKRSGSPNEWQNRKNAFFYLARSLDPTDAALMKNFLEQYPSALDYRTRSQDSLLHIALIGYTNKTSNLYKSNPDMIEAIIDFCKDYNPSLLDLANGDEETPLHIASYYSNCQAMKQLLTSDKEKKIRHNIPSKLRNNRVESQSVHVDAQDHNSGHTPVHFVVFGKYDKRFNPEGGGDLKALKILIENGANANIRDYNGKTPLDYLRGFQKNNRSSNHKNIIKELNKFNRKRKRKPEIANAENGELKAPKKQKVSVEAQTEEKISELDKLEKIGTDNIFHIEKLHSEINRLDEMISEAALNTTIVDLKSERNAKIECIKIHYKNHGIIIDVIKRLNEEIGEVINTQAEAPKQMEIEVAQTTTCYEQANGTAGEHASRLASQANSDTTQLTL